MIQNNIKTAQIKINTLRPKHTRDKSTFPCIAIQKITVTTRNNDCELKILCSIRTPNVYKQCTASTHSKVIYNIIKQNTKHPI